MGFSDLLASADRAVFATLGDDLAISYMPQAGSYAGEVTDLTGAAIFTDAYRLVDLGEAGISTAAPEVFVRESSLPGASDEGRNLEEDDPLITVGGKTYRRREVRRDGKGGVTFTLYEAE